MTDWYAGAHCRSCGAEIIWTLTEKGQRQPIDRVPTPAGNVHIVSGPHTPIAKVVGATIDLFDPTDDGTRYMPHHATCPDAASWHTEPRDRSTPGPKVWRTMHR